MKVKEVGKLLMDNERKMTETVGEVVENEVAEKVDDKVSMDLRKAERERLRWW